LPRLVCRGDGVHSGSSWLLQPCKTPERKTQIGSHELRGGVRRCTFSHKCVSSHCCLQKSLSSLFSLREANMSHLWKVLFNLPYIAALVMPGLSQCTAGCMQLVDMFSQHMTKSLISIHLWDFLLTSHCSIFFVPKLTSLRNYTLM
jgi:hypothetical protein